MTPTPEQRATEVADRFRRARFDPQEGTEVPYEALIGWINSAIRSAVEAETEECCKAVCGRCRKGEVPYRELPAADVFGKPVEWWHSPTEADKEWDQTTGSQTHAIVCDASAIRSRIQPLGKETQGRGGGSGAARDPESAPGAPTDKPTVAMTSGSPSSPGWIFPPDVDPSKLTDWQLQQGYGVTREYLKHHSPPSSPPREKCEKCGGSGADTDGRIGRVGLPDCPRCHGTGSEPTGQEGA